MRFIVTAIYKKDEIISDEQHPPVATLNQAIIAIDQIRTASPHFISGRVHDTMAKAGMNCMWRLDRGLTVVATHTLLENGLVYEIPVAPEVTDLPDGPKTEFR